MLDVADVLIRAELDEAATPVRYVNDVHGYHHGQIDGTIHAIPAAVDDAYDERRNSWRSIGHLNYSVYGGRAKIMHVGVDPEHQRRGVASGLYAELLKSHQHHEIEWGGTTSDGTKLKQAMDAEHGGYIRKARVARGLERARHRTDGGYTQWIPR